ncbi:hypothetical protein EOM81_10970 [bacterium]|nr:hypothetical protein [bacterium]
MKTVYLDTSIYNYLVKNESSLQSQCEAIDTAVKFKRIKITASLLNLQEIMLATPEIIKKILTIARRFTHAQILEEPHKILAKDFESFIRSKQQAKDIYASLNWYQALERGIGGAYEKLYKNIKAESEYHKYKKEYETNVKKICRAARTRKNPQEEFSLDNLLRHGRDREILKSCLKIYYSEEIAEILAREVDFKKCHRLRYMIKYDLHLMHGLLTRKIDLRYGDNVDMQHVVYAHDSSIFVTNDKPFLKNLSALKGEQTRFMSFEDFVAEVDYLNVLGRWQ